MQWPPRPGPGLNDMNPNGLVAAASTTSQTSIPIRSQSCASSLTSAMLTERKMFSSSFVSSAASAVETRWTSSTAPAVELAAASVEASSIPPTTFGVVFVVKSSRPGSTRSGAKARWKSVPAFRPLPSSSSGLDDLAGRARVRRRLEHDEVALRAGAARSTSRRARCRRGPARAAARAASGRRSRSRRRRRRRRSRSSRGSRPTRRAASSCSDGTSPMWLSPRLIASTTSSRTSTSTTFLPASAKAWACGMPT